MTVLTFPGYTTGMDTYSLSLYEEWMRSWGAAPTTIAKRVVVARVVMGRHPDPNAVRPEQLTAMLAMPGYSAWTRATYYGHLRSLFGWLADTGRIELDPTLKVRRPRSPAAKPRPLTAVEADRALHYANGSARAWLLLGMLAGLRAHETAKIHGADITEDALYVRGKGGKDSVLPTHPALWVLAQRYPSDDYWFPSPTEHRDHICPGSVSSRITRIFTAAGIVGSYHRCRHSYGTNLLRSGVNLRVVQDLMRHSSLATTAAYLGVDEDERRAAIGRLTCSAA